MMQVIYHTTTDENEELDKNYRHPKNIRQVGNPALKRKIYIEDYVVTYLSRLALPSNIDARGAILLGNVRKTEDGVAVFISGALDSQNFELDLNETIFTNENWANIYNEIREFFPDLFIVGWFVSRLGFSTELNGKIIQTHNNYFAGDNKVLYLIDSLEGEDDFYLYENNGLKRQKGYYIYYEKNDAMQSYMIAKQRLQQKQTRENMSLLKRDQKIVDSYRKVIEKGQKTVTKRKGDKQESKFYYVASTFLTIAIFAVGITIMNRYDKMVLLEATMGTVSSEKQVIEKDTEVTEEVEPKVKDPSEIGKSTLVEKEPSTEKVSENKVATYYIVKEGDTLNGISKKMFQSTDYVEAILSINQMTKETPIYPGQKLKIPALE